MDEWHVVNIRQIVFGDEQDTRFDENEVYEEEIESKTYLIYLKDKIVGTIRYREIEDRVFKIERFAILKEYRNKGIGKQALNFLWDLIIEQYNPCTITLNGQMHAFEFYKKCGFKEEGEEFLEARIRHMKMVKHS